MNDPRFRINVSQTAKGLHQFDATVEMDSDFLKVSDPNDAALVENITIGNKLLTLIKSTEDLFRKDGRRLVVDVKE